MQCTAQDAEVKQETRKKANITRPEFQTDLANAKRFVTHFGHRVRFVPSWNQFLVYDGKRWKLDHQHTGCLRLAQTVAKQVWLEVGKAPSKDAVQHGKRTSSAAGLSAMLRVAAPELAVDVDALDADPWLLNCPNGTVDLRTGELREHNPEDYLTKLCPTPFDPNAKCPLWQQTLQDVFNQSAPLVGFFQRLAGWWLTGIIRDHLLPIAWGCGANGKSTLLGTLLHVMGGDYAMQAPPDLLMMKRSETHPTERADLFGKRLVIASETEGGARLAESLVKQLTGGDRIRARRMREDFWEFTPSHKLVLCTNHKPRVKGQDYAIWRRLLLIPFTQVFDGPRADKTLPDRLRAEASGILAWAVRGCLAWQADGLNPPAEVRSATDEYRTSQDVIGRFAVECCEFGSTEFCVKFTDFYRALELWCTESGETLPGSKATAQWLADQGFERFRSNGIRYRGIGLKTESWNVGTEI